MGRSACKPHGRNPGQLASQAPPEPDQNERHDHVRHDETPQEVTRHQKGRDISASQEDYDPHP